MSEQVTVTGPKINMTLDNPSKYWHVARRLLLGDQIDIHGEKKAVKLAGLSIQIKAKKLLELWKHKGE